MDYLTNQSSYMAENFENGTYGATNPKTPQEIYGLSNDFSQSEFRCNGKCVPCRRICKMK